MKKSELRQIIREEINKVVELKQKTYKSAADARDRQAYDALRGGDVGAQNKLALRAAATRDHAVDMKDKKPWSKNPVRKGRLLNKEQGGEEIAEALPIPGTRQHDKTGMKTGDNKTIFRKGQVGGFLSDPEMDQAERNAHRSNNARRTGNTKNVAGSEGPPFE